MAHTGVVETREIQKRIAVLGVAQRRVAVLAGYDATWFSRALAGIRKLPVDFAWRVDAVIGALEEAQQAHDRTLAESLQRRLTERELLHRRRLHEGDRRKGCCETPRAWAEDRQPAGAPS